MNARQKASRRKRIEKHIDDGILTIAGIAKLERCSPNEVNDVKHELDNGRTAECSQCGETAVCIRFRGGQWCIGCALPDTKPEIQTFRSSALGNVRLMGLQYIDTAVG